MASINLFNLCPELPLGGVSPCKATQSSHANNSSIFISRTLEEKVAPFVRPKLPSRPVVVGNNRHTHQEYPCNNLSHDYNSPWIARCACVLRGAFSS